MNIKVGICLGMFVLLIGCNDRKEKNQHNDVKQDEKRLGDLVSAKFYKTISHFREDSTLVLDIFYPGNHIKHHRRRYVVAIFSIFSINEFLKDIPQITVRQIHVDSSEQTEIRDSLLFNKDDLNKISSLDKDDPVTFSLNAKILTIDIKTYDVLYNITRSISDSLTAGEFSNEPAPDLALFLDLYSDEIHRERLGVKMRTYLEYVHFYTYDPVFSEDVNPEIIKAFLDFGDSIYYKKQYPDELQKVLELRKIIPQKWKSNRTNI